MINIGIDMKRTVFFLTLLGFLAGSAFAQIDANMQTVAIVRLTRTESIAVGMLRGEVQRMERTAGRALTLVERRQLLDTMINERLALQAAERDNIYTSDAEINQQFQELRTILANNIGHTPTDAEFAQAVQNEYGLDVPAFREQLRRQLTVQKYLFAKKGNPRDLVTPPTDAEILENYNLRRAQFVRPQTVRVSVIQVPGGATAADRTRARERADALHREIGGNAGKFDEALIRAQANGADYQGGDGGYIPRNPQAQQALGADFINAAFSLRQGEVSRVIESPRGYEIIKVTET
jgi:parvulin-like peptidyl-prolyl isomerase